MNIYERINQLVSYALATALITPDDVTYTQNRLLELFQLDGFESPTDAAIPATETVGTAPTTSGAPTPAPDLEDILRDMLDYAGEKGIFPNDGVVSRDLFDTKIMGLLVARPSEIRREFFARYERSPKGATDWYYAFSQNTDYIRRYRIKKDVKWQSRTEYGDMDITINLSKPEKDPKAIAAARNAKQSGYPACLLCRENEGYAGRVNSPARQNHRVIPLTLNGAQWYLQYSPYVYYNEHCIVFSSGHTPMVINGNTFRALFDFVRQFPHYTIGSNADLPIVGGSILTHNHFQGGNYVFAMAKAPVETPFTVPGFEDVSAGLVKWPMSVIRLDGKDPARLVELSEKILAAWRGYTDESAFIFAETDGEKHNTITPIVRMNGGLFEIDLVLRNNITTDEHPLGVYHPHADLHHIKKENIGLIEVMGLAVLPARLKTELNDLADAILAGHDVASDETLAKHAPWVAEIRAKYPELAGTGSGNPSDVAACSAGAGTISGAGTALGCGASTATTAKERVERILRDEVALVFSRVLEDAGVYKRTPQGKEAFLRFVQSL